ncbi:MAG: hypothetical protein ACYDAP_00390 [Thermoplasmataceae archaeon]|jgi:hypothetical protein
MEILRADKDTSVAFLKQQKERYLMDIDSRIENLEHRKVALNSLLDRFPVEMYPTVNRYIEFINKEIDGLSKNRENLEKWSVDR